MALLSCYNCESLPHSTSLLLVWINLTRSTSPVDTSMQIQRQIGIQIDGIVAGLIHVEEEKTKPTLRREAGPTSSQKGGLKLTRWVGPMLAETRGLVLANPILQAHQVCEGLRGYMTLWLDTRWPARVPCVIQFSEQFQRRAKSRGRPMRYVPSC